MLKSFLTKLAVKIIKYAIWPWLT